MADAVATQIILDGSKKLVMKFTNLSDGTGESAIKKVDVSALSATKVKITKITFSTDGMAVQIWWDATTNVLAYTLAKDQTNKIGFKKVGGLINNAGVGVTGDLLFTTNGHIAGASYSIVLEMDKI